MRAALTFAGGMVAGALAIVAAALALLERLSEPMHVELADAPARAIRATEST